MYLVGTGGAIGMSTTPLSPPGPHSSRRSRPVTTTLGRARLVRTASW